VRAPLFEKREIDCVGHGSVANIVGMEMVSRSEAGRQSAGMIRIPQNRVEMLRLEHGKPVLAQFRGKDGKIVTPGFGH
jgi:hypothetical protein